MSPFPPQTIPRQAQSQHQHSQHHQHQHQQPFRGERRDYDPQQTYYITSTNDHYNSFREHQNHSQNIHPLFRSKAVCYLTCKHCLNSVCERGMKAILLADTRVELFSTDVPPNGRVQMVAEDYMTRNCRCKIRDVACLTCGNVVGYHVTQPCERCLEACNNGHFWMFHSDGVFAKERSHPVSGGPLLWAHLPSIDRNEYESYYEVYCR